MNPSEQRINRNLDKTIFASAQTIIYLSLLPLPPPKKKKLVISILHPRFL
jgi:hypothetical protein